MRNTRAQIRDDLLAYALADGLGLTVEHAELLLVLASRDGEPVTSAQLQYLVNPHRPLKLNVLQERVRAIRAVMGRDAIAGFTTAADRAGRDPLKPGRFDIGNYSLSAGGRSQCHAALCRVGASLPDAIATG